MSLVLIALEQRMHRFSELKRAIGGVSERMLAQTLQWLEADGLVDRKAYPSWCRRMSNIGLTPLGRECAEKVRLLADWIEVEPAADPGCRRRIPPTPRGKPPDRADRSRKADRREHGAYAPASRAPDYA